jgi:N-carbamoylputrescine amidase
LLAKCDLAKIEETRQSWPFLRDRRIDAYGSLLERSLEDRRRDARSIPPISK